MSINRQKLLEICLATLCKMSTHRSSPDGPTWQQTIDYSLVEWLLEVIIMKNPLENCRRIGSSSEWDNLPDNKSLFCSVPGCGLPIGNLTSQLFSNIYLNELDQYAKRTLHCRHYGRYVDDAYIVSGSRLHLKSLLPHIEKFLADSLGLSVNRNKLQIISSHYGVEFLGAFVKPYRTYISGRTFSRMRRKMRRLCVTRLSPRQMHSSVNSFLGLMTHYSTYRLRRMSLIAVNRLGEYGKFDGSYKKLILR